jgi:hypothetical protein
MPHLTLHGRRIDSVFSLLGEKENHITYSLGWALTRSPGFLRQFLGRAVGEWSGDDSGLSVLLQDSSPGSGITDIEIRSKDLHVIIEAKRGWELPSLAQLSRYAPRFGKVAATKIQRIVTMSECSQEYADHYLASSVAGIPLRHVSWRDLSHLTELTSGSHAEKRLMAELRNYMATIVSMQRQESNWVYVVSLNSSEWAPGLTFIQVVVDRHRYFHRYGRDGWPNEPPNYLGFRFDGKLQGIHHVEDAEVVRNFHPHFPERPDRDEDPCLLYRLGPRIAPAREVKTGAIYPSGRKWAMLDLLLTSSSIAEACAESNRRVKSSA